MPMANDVLKTNSEEITIPVIILLQRESVKNNAWIEQKWQAVGVLPAIHSTNRSNDISLVSSTDDISIYKYSGFEIKLTHDDLDSYYQNISSNNASVFIVCHEDSNNNPVPFLTTVSYDEAAVYMETDEIVYSVAINVAIYQTIERFVLENYKPEKRKKRALKKGSAGDYYKKENTYE